MNFEEFLKKEKIRNVRCGGTEDIILIKDLGEWAWKELVDFLKKMKYDSLEDADGEEQGAYYYINEIALACLGKLEVEKRLKELKK